LWSSARNYHIDPALREFAGDTFDSSSRGIVLREE
jgi:hypothetical protein